MKDFWIKKCLQPGTKGMEARKGLERAWKMYAATRWIPIVGWFFMPVVMKICYPTIEEVEEAMKNQRQI